MQYTIKSGDTLSKIASANGTTVSALMAANPSITNANVIRAGASLSIPPKMIHVMVVINLWAIYGCRSTIYKTLFYHTKEFLI